ncbi:hypothetical protein CMO93_01740 [Candidatus Woesearchaeota archaeon]|nr:hypothetical protein [Candidatus Woesearchaeota archaeon]|tara:strand:+ start:1491 stop:2747 length:1257 start_codon:yes stop_codon:yes gene_type:complete
MLKFIKKLFAKEEEKPEEKVVLSELGKWLDAKEKPLLESLKNRVNEIIGRVNEERKVLSDNLKKLEDAKLQNPNIPNRAKTIMEGNRKAFIKKVSHLFNNIDLKYEDFNEITRRSKDLEKDIDLLGKSTARTYQILSEFFAREIASIAEIIKKIETNSKSIRESVNYNKINAIKKIKNDVKDFQNKTRLKENILKELGQEKRNLEDEKNKNAKIEKNIEDIKSSENYKNFENLLKEKDEFEKQLKEIEDRLFHDFSVLEKALKKYGKIAFENGKLVESYLKDSVKALAGDEELKIISILGNLKQAVEEDKLELDEKKGGKALLKIKELDKQYFEALQKKYNGLKGNLEKINKNMKSNEAKNQLDDSKGKLDIIKNNINNIDNKIAIVNGELEKIDIEKLKKAIREEINEKLNEKIILV